MATDSQALSQDPHAQAAAQQTETKPRTAAANALLVVGFLLLVFIGIAIAVYASRYVPEAVNSFSSSNPVTGLPSSQSGSSPTGTNPSASEGAPSTSGTSIAFGEPQAPATSTGMITSTGVSEPQATNVGTAASSYTAQPFPTTGPMYSTLPGGYQAASAYPAEQSAYGYSARSNSYSAPYGLPDLSVNIVAVGYLANSSNSSFVPSPVIPVDAIAAVQFTIGNVGTAPTGPWAFVAQIPTDNGYNFQSPVEESMNPGDHILFTLAFNQVPPGPAELINIIADPNNYIQELTKSNNTAQASVSVVQS